MRHHASLSTCDEFLQPGDLCRNRNNLAPRRSSCRLSKSIARSYHVEMGLEIEPPFSRPPAYAQSVISSLQMAMSGNLRPTMIIAAPSRLTICARTPGVVTRGLFAPAFFSFTSKNRAEGGAFAAASLPLRVVQDCSMSSLPKTMHGVVTSAYESSNIMGNRSIQSCLPYFLRIVSEYPPSSCILR